MEKIIAFNTMGEFRDVTKVSLIEKSIAEKIEDEVKEYCKKHNKRITYISIGDVDGSLTVTCILQTKQKTKNKLKQGKQLVYIFNLETQVGEFETIDIRKDWTNSYVRDE